MASYPIYPMRQYHPFYKALRFRHLFQRSGEKLHVQEFPDVLPQLQLVQDYRVIGNHADILLALNDAVFDPKKTVFLERLPSIRCDPFASSGTVSLIEESTDQLLIEARTPTPAILLVTDGWSKNWVASAADGSKAYKVMPVDYVLRAIPLEAGEHLIRLEYRSLRYTIGKWISLVALIVYTITVGVVCVLGQKPSTRRRNAVETETSGVH